MQKAEKLLHAAANLGELLTMSNEVEAATTFFG